MVSPDIAAKAIEGRASLKRRTRWLAISSTRSTAASSANSSSVRHPSRVLRWPTDAGSLARVAAERLALPDWYGDLSAPGKDLWESVIFDACMGHPDTHVGFRRDGDGVTWDLIDLCWQHLGVVPGAITDTALSTFGTRPYRYHPRTPPPITREQYDQELAEVAAGQREFDDMLDRLRDDVAQGRKSLDQVLDAFIEQVGPSLDEMLGDPGEDAAEGEGSDLDDWQPMHSTHTPNEVRGMLEELRSVRPAIEQAVKTDLRQQYLADLLPAIERIASDGRMLFVQGDT